MNEVNYKGLIFSLLQEDDLEEKKTLETLKTLSKDLDTLRQTKIYINDLVPNYKKLLQENVLSVLKRKSVHEETTLLYITTFIVALVFGIFSVLFEGDLFGQILLAIAAGIIVWIAVRGLRKRDHIYRYKLIVFIENLDV